MKAHLIIYLLYTVAKSLKLKIQGGIGHSCYDFRPDLIIITGLLNKAH